ncbi:MAG: hypothetical protein LBU50_03925 [Cellulomonas sp.]|jgi:hypothetical protein|nr:hypothetical protein [Cellulomonas sp.]
MHVDPTDVKPGDLVRIVGTAGPDPLVVTALTRDEVERGYHPVDDEPGVGAVARRLDGTCIARQGDLWRPVHRSAVCLTWAGMQGGLNPAVEVLFPGVEDQDDEDDWF